MNRPILSSEQMAPEVLNVVTNFHKDVVSEVINAVQNNKVVVVGMASNPHVKEAKKALAGAGIEFKYLEYGSYFSGWKKRLAIKLWSGWATYPQVFVDGKLIGGGNETKKLVASGAIKK
jgi:glutaredoxin-related protein